MTDNPRRNGYVCFYESKRFECHAADLYSAKLAAIEHFKPPRSKRHMISVTLAEVDGKPITHRADF